MKRAPRQKEQFECYQLAILKWWLEYFSRRAKEEHDEYFNLALNVELLQPIKGAQAGHLTLYGSTTDYGGFLDYNIDRALRGALWIGQQGAAALVTVLSLRDNRSSSSSMGNLSGTALLLLGMSAGTQKDIRRLRNYSTEYLSVV